MSCQFFAVYSLEVSIHPIIFKQTDKESPHVAVYHGSLLINSQIFDLFSGRGQKILQISCSNSRKCSCPLGLAPLPFRYQCWTCLDLPSSYKTYFQKKKKKRISQAFGPNKDGKHSSYAVRHLVPHTVSVLGLSHQTQPCCCCCCCWTAASWPRSGKCC